MNGNFPNLVGDVRGLQLLLCPADRGHFGRRVDDAGDDLVVHVAVLAGEDLGERHALVFGLVGEHRPAHHVADRVDAGDVGGKTIVDRDAGRGSSATPASSRPRPSV